MKHMKTLSQVMAILTKRGYTVNFSYSGDGITSGEEVTCDCDQFNIDKTYRFEGMSDPDDNAILYAVSDLEGNPKGLLVDAYGVYAHEISDRLKSKLTEAERNSRTFDEEE